MGQFVDAGEVRLFVAEFGVPTSREALDVPLLAVHGGPDWDHTYLEPGLVPLARGRRVLAMDVRGCGRSTRQLGAGQCQPDRVVEDIRAVIEAQPTGRVHLLGFSWGGQVVQLFVERYPDLISSLILASTTAYGHDHQRRHQRAMPEWHERRHRCPARVWPPPPQADLAEISRRWAFAQVPMDVWDESLFDSYRDLLRGVDFSGEWLTEALRNGMGPTRPEDPVEVLRRLEVPVLILHGQYDLGFPLTLAEQLDSALPDAHLHVLHGAGHMAHVEQPAQWAGAINEFIGRGD